MYTLYPPFKSWVKKRLTFIRFSLSSNNSLLFRGYYRYLYQPKEGSLSAFLNAYSLSRKNELCVIQIGANDGITHDPIHKYIKRDNWQGVLLEPQSEVFDKYLSRIYRKNHKIHTLNAALGVENGSQKIYKVGFCDMRWATGLATFKRSTLEDAFRSGKVKKNCQRYGIPYPEAKKDQIMVEEVEVICPQTLLTQYGIDQIDLLQIDTEGFDYQIIQMFNIPICKPRVIIYENVHLCEEDKLACRQLLMDNDYCMKDYGSNTVAMQSPVGSFEKYFE